MNRFFDFFGNLLVPEKNRLGTTFNEASGPAASGTVMIDAGHSLTERIIRDEFNIMKSQWQNNAFLLYFHTTSFMPRGLRVTQDDIEKTSLAKTMRAILSHDNLAVVLDLRGQADFDGQWPFKPGTVQSLEFFKDVGTLMPKQFQFFRKNMPDYKPDIELNYPDDPSYYGA